MIVASWREAHFNAAMAAQAIRLPTAVAESPRMSADSNPTILLPNCGAESVEVSPLLFAAS